MIIRISANGANISIQPQVMRVVRVYNHRVPSGIPESAFTAKGDILIGTGAGTYTAFPAGSSGQYLTPDSTTPTGWKLETPSISISAPTNFLINGGFSFAQRQAPGTLTSISDNKYSADRWKITRENADLQYQRNDASGESGLTSLYYGKFKKITNAGKFLVCQIIEGINSLPLRNKTVIFQAKMKASSSKTIRMAVLELNSSGTMDSIPASLVSSWNVDSTDPTLGTNLAVITGAESKSVTTSWQNFYVIVTIPSTSKNVIVALWSDADFSANDELNIAEAGLFVGATTLAWTPRPTGVELALCRRYYFKTFELDTAPAQNAGFYGAYRFVAGKAGANPEFSPTYNYPVAMRISPSVTFYNPAASNAQVRDTSASADCSSTTLKATSTADNMALQCTGNASTAVGNALDVHISAEADL